MNNNQPTTKPFIILGVTGIVLSLIFFIGLSFDSARILRSSYSAVTSTDNEIKIQEERLLTVLSSIIKINSKLESIINEYYLTKDIAKRQALFQQILMQVGQLKPTDPTDPLARRYADEYAGALNRRQIAMRHYQQAVMDYNEFAQSFRGKIVIKLTALPKNL